MSSGSLAAVVWYLLKRRKNTAGAVRTTGRSAETPQIDWRAVATLFPTVEQFTARTALWLRYQSYEVWIFDNVPEMFDEGGSEMYCVLPAIDGIESRSGASTIVITSGAAAKRLLSKMGVQNVPVYRYGRERIFEW